MYNTNSSGTQNFNNSQYVINDQLVQPLNKNIGSENQSSLNMENNFLTEKIPELYADKPLQTSQIVQTVTGVISSAGVNLDSKASVNKQKKTEIKKKNNNSLQSPSSDSCSSSFVSSDEEEEADDKLSNQPSWINQGIEFYTNFRL